MYEGRAEALTDKAIIAKKQAEEDDFRKKVAANPEWQKEFGGAWETIAATEKKAAPRTKAMIFRRTDSRLFTIARQIEQYVVEVKKPDGERLPGYHDAQLETLMFQLKSPAKIYPETEKLYMTTALTLAEEKLGKDDEYLKALTDGKDIESFVNAGVDGTKLYDPEFRKSLIEGGEAAVAASTDPMIVAARRTDALSREYQRWQRDEIASVLTQAGEKLGKARFLVYGKDAYPDATFTLRLSYGTVKGFPYNGTIAPPFTTFYGLYDRAASFSNQPPFDLTPKEAAGRDKLDLSTPLDFVSTGDIIGGNSGSPVVNRDGELVGLIFDGNIESLAGDFVYEDEKNRAVAVHSAGMMEALRTLTGSPTTPLEPQVSSPRVRSAEPSAASSRFRNRISPVLLNQRQCAEDNEQCHRDHRESHCKLRDARTAVPPATAVLTRQNRTTPVPIASRIDFSPGRETRHQRKDGASDAPSIAMANT